MLFSLAISPSLFAARQPWAMRCCLPLRSRAGLLTAYYKSSGFPRLTVPRLWCKPMVRVVFAWALCASPVGQGGQRQSAACWAVSDKVVSDPRIMCVLLWNSSGKINPRPDQEKNGFWIEWLGGKRCLSPGAGTGVQGQDNEVRFYWCGLIFTTN